MPVPGMAGTHELGPGGPILNQTIIPRYRLTAIPGFRSLGTLEDARDLPAGRSREIPRKALRRGKAFTYQGVVEAQNQDDLDSMVDQLVAACAPTDEQLVSISPRLTGGGFYTYYGRITAIDIPEQHPDPSSLGRPTRGFERTFAIGVQMSDPRFLGQPQFPVSTSGLTSVGGTPLPWVLPVTLLAPGSSSGTAVISYVGTAPGDFTATFTGPATNPGLRSDTLGKELRFRIALGTDDILRVDFNTRSVLLNDVDDAGGLIDRERSDWWDGDTAGLVPGNNVLRYVGDTLQDPAHASILYAYKYWS